MTSKSHNPQSSYRNSDKTQASKIILLGHSAGGQLLGITPNYDKVAYLIAVSGSTGYVKGLKGRTKFLAPLMFNVIFPTSTLIKGYGATKFIGMGENLPKNVAKQWAQFYSRPGYVSNAIEKPSFIIFINIFNAQSLYIGVQMMKFQLKVISKIYSVYIPMLQDK